MSIQFIFLWLKLSVFQVHVCTLHSSDLPNRTSLNWQTFSLGIPLGLCAVPPRAAISLERNADTGLFINTSAWDTAWLHEHVGLECSTRGHSTCTHEHTVTCFLTESVSMHTMYFRFSKIFRCKIVSGHWLWSNDPHVYRWTYYSGSGYVGYTRDIILASDVPGVTPSSGA